MDDVLKPIQEQIQQWILYEEETAGGNANSNIIFSLWRPLRFTLARINGYPKLNQIGNMDDKISFLKELSKYDLNLFLPTRKSVVLKLVKLFELGMTRANVMVLPYKEGKELLNCLRNQEPFYDYMPYFLYECFEGGRFAQYFASHEKFKTWVKEQHLEMFFEENVIAKERVKDLSGMNDYRKSIPLDIEKMIDNYIEILEKRSLFMGSIG